MTSDFWKIRYGESIYILSSRIFISVMTLYLLHDDNVWLSSCFLAIYFLSKSVFGFFLAHKFEQLGKKRLLTQLIFLFICMLLTTMLLKSLSVSLLALIPIAIGVGFVEAFFSPVVNAFIPTIVDKNFITEAFRKTFLIQASNNLFGIAIGMGAYQWVGFENMIWAIILLSLASLVILHSISCKGIPVSSSPPPSSNNMKNSIAIFMGYRFEPWWAFSSMVVNMFLVSFSSFIIPYFIIKVVGGEPVTIGLIEGCAAGGAIFSSCYLQKKIEPIIGKSRSVILSFFAIGICFLLFSFTNHIGIWSILAFIIGIAIVMNNVSIESSRSIAIPERNRVKVQTIHNAFIGIGNPLGLLLTPFMIANYGYVSALIVSASVIIVISIFIRFIPLFYELLAHEQDDIADLYEREYGGL
ncbi:MFS transporter [Xenorhabdus mauleonii]|uniref:MFS transporter n=1 Tax=Xenorhabdus mauleonii TaxID=351675 RepID=A0A1I3KF66_9GAMM|nr:MFS transporter [Xenorhabdus mauleonii]PHM45032.1 MFS transporter [Xenorhabdus mauleonii]SFI71132.1 Predicted arabinose efflux permease, MFS family [Xenorhabdus mauleonii]